MHNLVTPYEINELEPLEMAHEGKILRRLRDDLRLTQTELAIKAGVSLPTIQKNEKLERLTLTGPNFRAVAGALGMTYEALDSILQRVNGIPTGISPIVADPGAKAGVRRPGKARAQGAEPKEVSGDVLCADSGSRARG